MIILFLLISLTAFAHDEEECLPPGLPSEDVLLKAAMAPLKFWVVTNAQMENAPCKTKTPPSINELDQSIKAYSEGTQETKVINGVTLKDDPKLLNMFERLTTKWIYPNKADHDQKNFQTLFSINPSCEKVSCAMEKIWGNKYSKQLSYLFLNYGFNSSEYSFINADRFTEKEMDDVLIGLKDFPPSMGPFARENRQLTRYTRGKWEIRPGTFADSQLQIYDPWTRAASMERHQTIFHEVAHILAENKNLDWSNEWFDFSGWVKKGEKWQATKPSCMVSKYGTNDPGEDFAETAVAYRYNPSRLYKACPEKYKYMKKIFNGNEYFSKASCTDALAKKEPAVPKPVEVTVAPKTMEVSAVPEIKETPIKLREVLEAPISVTPTKEVTPQVPTKPIMTPKKKKANTALKKHLSIANNRLRKIPNWKNMGPKAFCRATYARPSKTITRKKVLRKLFTRCVRLQSTRSKRFKLTSKSFK